MISCGPTAVYGDYVNSDGMTRKEIESIYNHPHVQIGISSYYGKEFHKKRTASGQIFDMHKISAAHKTLPLGTRIRVTNLKNGRSLTMTIIDRGPFVKGRILDVSYKAARKLGFVNEGTTKVRVDVLRLGNNKYYK
jgi:rare lipoprotein A